MKRFATCLASGFFVASLILAGLQPAAAASLPLQTSSKIVEFAPGEVIVKFKNQTKTSQYLADRKLKLKSHLKAANTDVLELTDAKEPVLRAVKRLKTDPAVESVQPNYKYYSLSIPTNDTFKDLLWGLENTGQTVNGTSGVVDADIDAPLAWPVSEGAGVTVAVIDTGVDYTHADLSLNMWDGTNCKDENGNFLGGCLHGYDYEFDDVDPYPDFYDHGTHVAGTIAAVKNNSEGTIGVAPQAKIMAIKTALFTDELVRAVGFAQANGAKIINASFGGPGSDPLFESAVSAFPGLFVAAAGNNSSNNDGGSHMYPCDYTFANVVCVAASDQADALAGFSNYGAVSVDVAAPGVNIASTIPGGFYAYSDGTSMATPHVVGQAAAIMSAQPSLSVAQVKNLILTTGDALPSLSGKVASGRRINLFNSLQVAVPTATPTATPTPTTVPTSTPTATPSPTPTPSPTSTPTPTPTSCPTGVNNIICVTTTSDVVVKDNLCSLREAINNANANADTTSGDCVAGSTPPQYDRVQFQTTGTINLNSPLPKLTERVALENPTDNPSDLVINGQGVHQIFSSDPTTTGNFSVRGMSIINGRADNGGGFEFLGSGILTCVHSVFQDNHANQSGGAIYADSPTNLHIQVCKFDNNSSDSAGGAISINEISNPANNTGLIIQHSEFTGNTSNLSAGGALDVGLIDFALVFNSTFSSNIARFGGAITNQSNNLSISNSTFSGNIATSNFGGGLDNYGRSTLTNVTFHNNSSTHYGGAVINHNGLPSPFVNYPNASVSLLNTIVSSPASQRENCSGIIIDSGTNLQFGGQAANSCGPTIPTADPLLLPLANNGGLTQTNALQVGSPAIDAGTTIPGGNFDQRGVSRPQGAGFDIGSYEYDGVVPTVTPTPTPTTTPTATPSPTPTSTPFPTSCGGYSATFAVDTTQDIPDSNLGDRICNTSSGTCSLRAALQEANLTPANSTNPKICLEPITYPLSGGQLDINFPVQIFAPVGTQATIDAQHLSRVFRINSGSPNFVGDNATNLTRLVIKNGKIDNTLQEGGGIVIGNNSLVFIDNSTLSGNETGSIGGAVHITSTATSGSLLYISYSTLSNNKAGGGGAISSFGAPVSLVNSTISGNNGVSHSGAIYISGLSMSPQVTLSFTTVSNNSTAPGGSAISGNANGATFSLWNTLIANNSGKNCAATVSSRGYNLSSDSSCGLNNTGDRNAVDPLLQVLASNGGLTQTHALSASSPAIDAGSSSFASQGGVTYDTDQRGATRPQGAGYDIGAYEFDGGAPVTPTPTPTDSVTPTPTPTDTPTPTPTVTPIPTPTPYIDTVITHDCTTGSSCAGITGVEVVGGNYTPDARVKLIAPDGTELTGTYVGGDGVTTILTDFVNLVPCDTYTAVVYFPSPDARTATKDFVYNPDGTCVVPTPTPTPTLVPTPTPTPTPEPTSTPTSTPTPTSVPEENRGGGGDNNNGPVGAPVCTDAVPGSAPVLLSAEVGGTNEVTLTWSKAKDPVTYYLVTYGTKPGSQEYGNPNVGGRDTTTFTVGSLSAGKTYYFKVRAGNNCMPGPFSNELAVRPTGRVFNEVPEGFEAGVLGEETGEGEITPTAAATETSAVIGGQTTKQCTDPVWRIGLLIAYVAALVWAALRAKSWAKTAGPAGAVTMLVVLLAFCVKAPWVVVTLVLLGASYLGRQLMAKE